MLAGPLEPTVVRGSQTRSTGLGFLPESAKGELTGRTVYTTHLGLHITLVQLYRRAARGGSLVAPPPLPPAGSKVRQQRTALKPGVVMVSEKLRRHRLGAFIPAGAVSLRADSQNSGAHLALSLDLTSEMDQFHCCRSTTCVNEQYQHHTASMLRTRCGGSTAALRGWRGASLWPTSSMPLCPTVGRGHLGRIRDLASHDAQFGAENCTTDTDPAKSQMSATGAASSPVSQRRWTNCSPWLCPFACDTLAPHPSGTQRLRAYGGKFARHSCAGHWSVWA